VYSIILLPRAAIKCPGPDLSDGVVITRVQMDYSSGNEYSYGQRVLEYGYGTRLTLVCGLPQQSLKGSRYLSCGQAGKWSGPLPACEGEYCAIQKFTSNFQYSYTSAYYT